jgi:hypothetical protein
VALLAPLTAPSLIAVTGPFHGLGNRVRVVLGSRSLARFEGRRFFYTWTTGAQFGVRFDELWQIDDPVLPRTLARALALRFPFRDQRLEWLTNEVRRERVIQIRTAHALHLPAGADPWEEELQSLRPVESVAGRVHDVFDRHLVGEPYVGVMLRSHPHSHAETLRRSPLSWYVERMRRIRDAAPGIRFFVSADTPAGQQALCDEFPGSVSLNDKGDYNSAQALRSSVVDLYLLAGSTHVLGPHFSSFPELAQKLAGPALTLETSTTTADVSFEALAALGRVDDPTRPHLRRPA